MDDSLNRTIEKVITNLMILFPHISRETAERTLATMIEYPQMMQEYKDMMKEKRQQDNSEEN